MRMLFEVVDAAGVVVETAETVPPGIPVLSVESARADDPAFRGLKLARRLYAGRRELARRYNLARSIVGAYCGIDWPASSGATRARTNSFCQSPSGLPNDALVADNT